MDLRCRRFAQKYSDLVLAARARQVLGTHALLSNSGRASSLRGVAKGVTEELASLLLVRCQLFAYADDEGGIGERRTYPALERAGQSSKGGYSDAIAMCTFVLLHFHCTTVTPRTYQ